MTIIILFAVAAPIIWLTYRLCLSIDRDYS